MKVGRRGLLTSLVVAAILAYAVIRRRGLLGILDNLRRYSAPSVAIYDAATSPFFAGFFSRIARELIRLNPRAAMLEIGSGPGRLAVTLAETGSEARIVGVDISSEMAERATNLAARHGVAGRVSFAVGDAAALPFADASFDLVVSTFSMHHWSNPGKGLAEIARVLRPGGVARIYDLADWITRFENPRTGISDFGRLTPLGSAQPQPLELTFRLGPVPVVYRAELRVPSSLRAPSR